MKRLKSTVLHNVYITAIYGHPTQSLPMTNSILVALSIQRWFLFVPTRAASHQI